MNNLKQTRRSFLVHTGILAASPFFISRLRAAESANDKLNIGVIGVSNRAGEDLAGVSSQNIVALCDVDANQAAKSFAKYPNVRQLTWVQEEPMNMGAYWHVKRRLEPRLPKHLTLHYVGRPERASPSEGYAIAHEAQETRIVETALGHQGESSGATASG